jgi:hypothetical protein
MSIPPSNSGSSFSNPENKNNHGVSKPVPVGIGSTPSSILPIDEEEIDYRRLFRQGLSCSPCGNQHANVIITHLNIENYQLALNIYNQLNDIEKELAKDKIDQYFKNQEYRKQDMTEWREKFKIPKTS